MGASQRLEIELEQTRVRLVSGLYIYLILWKIVRLHKFRLVQVRVNYKNKQVYTLKKKKKVINGFAIQAL